jgi:glycine betaine/choline ABC-type transport system substrate-binding protein
VNQEYREQFGLEWTESLGFNNSFAFMIRGADARRLGVSTISQAAAHTPRWQAGFGCEFIERDDGYAGLAEVYGLEFAEPPREMYLGLMYRALGEGQVDFIAGNSTEGLVEALGLALLEDDRRYFPPLRLVPISR